MAYPNYTSSSGVKTATTIKAAGTKGETYVYDEIIIQNQSTAIMYIKFGASASSSDYDIALKGCTVTKDGTSIPIVLTKFADAQEISAASSDLKYTYTIR